MPAPGQSNLVFVPIAPDGLAGGVGRRQPIPCDLYNTLKIGRGCSQGIDFVFVSGCHVEAECIGDDLVKVTNVGRGRIRLRKGVHGGSENNNTVLSQVTEQGVEYGILPKNESGTMTVGDTLDLIMVAQLPERYPPPGKGLVPKDPVRYVLRFAEEQEAGSGGTGCLSAGNGAKKVPDDGNHGVHPANPAASPSLGKRRADDDGCGASPGIAAGGILKDRCMSSMETAVKKPRQGSESASQGQAHDDDGDDAQGSQMTGPLMPMEHETGADGDDIEEEEEEEVVEVVEELVVEQVDREALGRNARMEDITQMSDNEFAEWAASKCRGWGVPESSIEKMLELMPENQVDAEVLEILSDKELLSSLGLPELSGASGLPRDRLACELAGRRLRAIVSRQPDAPKPLEHLYDHLCKISTDDMCKWAMNMLGGEDDAAAAEACKLFQEQRVDGPCLFALSPAEAAKCFGGQSELARMWGDARTVLKEFPDAALPDPSKDIVTFCVWGGTGAGKSTMLNALLGKKDLLPTNAMRACTAAIIEMGFSSDLSSDHRFSAKIEFLSEEAWRAEIEQAFAVDDEREGGGAADKEDEMEVDDDGADVGGEGKEDKKSVQRARVCAAYGRGVDWTAGVDAILGKECPINSSLGTTVTMRAGTGEELRIAYEKYADSSNESAQGSLWPIVQRIRLEGPWPVLAGGVVLVDAPGLADDNSARDEVVKGYIKKSNGVLLVSNIKRAVNDKTTMELLSAGFKQQVLDDGVRGSLAYIATQSDVLQRSEVIQNLDLEENASLIECVRERNKFFCKTVSASFMQGLAMDGELDRDDEDAAATASGRPDDDDALLDGGADEEEKGDRGGSREDGGDEKGQGEGREGAASGSSVKDHCGGQTGMATFAVSAIAYQIIQRIRGAGDGEAAIADAADTQIPALKEYIRSSACALRATEFVAGASLFANIEAAKQRAQQEEQDAMNVDAQGAQAQDYRSKLREAMGMVVVGYKSPAHRACEVMPDPHRVFRLCIDGVGRIGLPLCGEQAAAIKAAHQSYIDSGRLDPRIVQGDFGGAALVAAKHACNDLGLDYPEDDSPLQTRLSHFYILEAGIHKANVEVPAASSDEVYLRVVVQIPSEYSIPKHKAACLFQMAAAGEGEIARMNDSDASADRLIAYTSFHQCGVRISPPDTGRAMFAVVDIIYPLVAPTLSPPDNSEALRRLKQAVKMWCDDENAGPIGILVDGASPAPPMTDKFVEIAMSRREQSLCQLLATIPDVQHGAGSINILDSPCKTKRCVSITQVLMPNGALVKLSIEPKFNYEEEGGGVAVHDRYRTSRDLMSMVGKADLFDGVHGFKEVRHGMLHFHNLARGMIVVWPRSKTTQLLLSPRGYDGLSGVACSKPEFTDFKSAIEMAHEHRRQALTSFDVELIVEHVKKDPNGLPVDSVTVLLKVLRLLGQQCKNVALAFMPILWKDIISRGRLSDAGALEVAMLCKALGGWPLVGEIVMEHAKNFSLASINDAILSLGPLFVEHLDSSDVVELFLGMAFNDPATRSLQLETSLNATLIKVALTRKWSGHSVDDWCPGGGLCSAADVGQAIDNLGRNSRTGGIALAFERTVEEVCAVPGGEDVPEVLTDQLRALLACVHTSNGWTGRCQQGAEFPNVEQQQGASASLSDWDLQRMRMFESLARLRRLGDQVFVSMTLTLGNVLWGRCYVLNAQILATLVRCDAMRLASIQTYVDNKMMQTYKDILVASPYDLGNLVEKLRLNFEHTDHHQEGAGRGISLGADRFLRSPRARANEHASGVPMMQDVGDDGLPEMPRLCDTSREGLDAVLACVVNVMFSSRWWLTNFGPDVRQILATKFGPIARLSNEILALESPKTAKLICAAMLCKQTPATVNECKEVACIRFAFLKKLWERASADQGGGSSSSSSSNNNSTSISTGTTWGDVFEHGMNLCRSLDAWEIIEILKTASKDTEVKVLLLPVLVDSLFKDKSVILRVIDIDQNVLNKPTIISPDVPFFLECIARAHKVAPLQVLTRSDVVTKIKAKDLVALGMLIKASGIAELFGWTTVGQVDCLVEAALRACESIANDANAQPCWFPTGALVPQGFYQWKQLCTEIDKFLKDDAKQEMSSKSPPYTSPDHFKAYFFNASHQSMRKMSVDFTISTTGSRGTGFPFILRKTPEHALLRGMTKKDVADLRASFDAFKGKRESGSGDGAAAIKDTEISGLNGASLGQGAVAINRGSAAAGQADPEFSPSSVYIGPREGFVYKAGAKGLGYYKDLHASQIAGALGGGAIGAGGGAPAQGGGGQGSGGGGGTALIIDLTDD